MSVANPSVQTKAPYFPGKRDMVIAFLILVGIGGYLLWKYPDWPWGRIGAIVALVTVVLMLFRDGLESYGDGFKRNEDADRWD